MSKKEWSDEEEAALIKMYTDGSSVYEVAEFFNKKHRSVISKLVQLKIYRKPPPRSKNASVKELIRELEKLLDIYIDANSLNKREHVQQVLEAVRQLVKQ